MNLYSLTRSGAILAFSALVRAMSLARAVSDEKLSLEILKAVAEGPEDLRACVTRLVERRRRRVGRFLDATRLREIDRRSRLKQTQVRRSGSGGNPR